MDCRNVHDWFISVLAVDCQMRSNGARVVSWYGVDGRFCTFEYCDAPGQSSWESYPFEIPGSGSVVSVLDRYDGERSYYRVKGRKP